MVSNYLFTNMLYTIETKQTKQELLILAQYLKSYDGLKICRLMAVSKPFKKLKNYIVTNFLSNKICRIYTSFEMKDFSF